MLGTEKTEEYNVGQAATEQCQVGKHSYKVLLFFESLYEIHER